MFPGGRRSRVELQAPGTHTSPSRLGHQRRRATPPKAHRHASRYADLRNSGYSQTSMFRPNRKVTLAFESFHLRARCRNRCAKRVGRGQSGPTKRGSCHSGGRRRGHAATLTRRDTGVPALSSCVPSNAVIGSTLLTCHRFGGGLTYRRRLDVQAEKDVESSVADTGSDVDGFRRDPRSRRCGLRRRRLGQFGVGHHDGERRGM